MKKANDQNNFAHLARLFSVVIVLLMLGLTLGSVIPVVMDKLQQQSAPVLQPTRISPKTNTGIQIKGNQECNDSTMDALELLNTKANVQYTEILKHIGIIECTSKGSGMFANEDPPRYSVGDATRNAGTIWYAGTIAHDACHSKLYSDYRVAHLGEPIPPEIWTGEAAERTCLDVQYDTLTKIGGTQAQLDDIKNAINTKYYDVPYNQRWW